MSGRLFLIHWKESEALELAKPLRSAGWQVDIEAEDGARAGRKIRADPPDVVLIYLTRLPSHGRETAAYLKSTPATRAIPIVFVDGSPEKVERVRARLPEAEYTNSGLLPGVLVRYLPLKGSD